MNEEFKKFLPSKEHLDQIDQKLKDARSKVTELIKEHPLTSVALATGIGFILAKLLKRRD